MKKKILILSLALFLAIAAVVFVFLLLPASIDYSMMSFTEKLKFHIEEERQVYSDKIFDEVEVIRPWYSIDPAKWTYRVTFADGGEVVNYEYTDGDFSRIDP